MIAYFSCTGNSRRVAQLLAERLVDNVVDLRPLLRAAEPSVSIDGGKLVFVFPIHSWGLPKGFADFLTRLRVNGCPQYCCMVATCGDDCGLAARQWREVMEAKGMTADAAYSVQMPNTYVIFPGFDVDKSEVEQRKLSAVPQAADALCRRIEAMEKGDFTHHGSVAWLKSRIIYPWFMRHVDDRQFTTTDACVGCGRCAAPAPPPTSQSPTISRNGTVTASTASPATTPARITPSHSAGAPTAKDNTPVPTIKPQVNDTACIHRFA